MFHKISILGFVILFFIDLLITERGNAVKSRDTFYTAPSDFNPIEVGKICASLH